MKRKTSCCQYPNEDDNEAEEQNLVSMFNRIHKFQTNTEIEIRVYQGAKEFPLNSLKVDLLDEQYLSQSGS